MNLNISTRSLIMAASAAAACTTISQPQVKAESSASKPNIIIILADDMGYSDLGCYGSEIKTPNLDKLAAGGVRFTQMYNMSRCCPSRASILTGLYAHQAGVGNMTQNFGVPAYQGFLNEKCATIAQVLKGVGYFTAMAGKWHVGGEEFVSTSPWTRGFDRSLSAKAGGFYYGAPEGKGKETPLWLDGKNLSSGAPELPANWYTTDLFTDYGIKFIEQALNEKKPFFLYLAHTAPHFPFQAPDEDIAKYRGKYMVGWDKLREQRYKWQLEHGIIDASWPLSPLPKSVPKTDDVPPWDSLSNEEKERSDHIMSIYAACVDHMDQSVGRLVDELKKRNVFDNTLIIFLSDNGAEKGGGVLGKLNEKKGSDRLSAFCGQAWATLENTPFRLYKASEHEGGISTPMIAHWPKEIKNGGAIIKERAHIIDLMATCVDVSGAQYPKEINGKAILPMEGKSLVPAFSGGKIGHDILCWEHVGNAAILEGDWKLVRFGKTGPWELYNLSRDRTELNNLADKEPARVKDLDAKWEAWAKRTGVLPYPEREEKQEGRADKKEKKKDKKGGGGNGEMTD